jgi:hypothetical protein
MFGPLIYIFTFWFNIIAIMKCEIRNMNLQGINMWLPLVFYYILYNIIWNFKYNNEKNINYNVIYWKEILIKV